MSLSEIVLLYVMCKLCVGVRRALYPLLLFFVCFGFLKFYEHLLNDSIYTKFVLLRLTSLPPTRTHYKIALHQRNPSNLKELEQFCLEDWAKILVARCAKLIETYPKRLAVVIAAKGGSTKYLLWKVE